MSRWASIPSGVISDVILSHNNNPYGSTNADGIYYINTQGNDLTIENARLDLGLWHLERDREQLGRLAESVSRAQGAQVGFEHLVLELGRQPLFDVLGRSVIEPAEQAQCEEVLAAVHLSLA